MDTVGSASFTGSTGLQLPMSILPIMNSGGALRGRRRMSSEPAPKGPPLPSRGGPRRPRDAAGEHLPRSELALTLTCRTGDFRTAFHKRRWRPDGRSFRSRSLVESRSTPRVGLDAYVSSRVFLQWTTGRAHPKSPVLFSLPRRFSGGPAPRPPRLWNTFRRSQVMLVRTVPDAPSPIELGGRSGDLPPIFSNPESGRHDL